MRRPAAFFPIALTLTAIIFAPRAGAQAQAGPTELTACQPISQPGSYKLVNNLTFTASPPTGGTCLPITAAFVTIDLAGFTISASPSNFSPTAIAANGGTTVRNGSISGFAVGVDLRGSYSVVEGLRVVGGTGKNSLGIAAMGIVRDNTVVEFDAGPGTGLGIQATGIVTGNYISGNRATGMLIGEGSSVIGNTATQNGYGSEPGVGISVECPSNVTDNTVVNNVGMNLVLNGTGCNNTNNVAP
jgi:hypothetical protein